MKLKLKGQTKILKITIEDKDFLNASEIFLKDIEKNFLKYKKDYEEKYKSLEKYLKSGNYIFTPESLSKKSPLTLVNAPWGTGKTFFIENFLKLNIDKKLKSSIFEKMIIIDAWKYSNSQDVPLEFVKELFLSIIKSKNNLGQTNFMTTVKNAVIMRGLKTLLPDSVSIKVGIPFLSVDASYNLRKLKKDDEDKIEELYKQILKNKQPTIIFIDNIERLGSHSWDLLKTLLKFQKFDNFLLILMINLNVFKKNFKKEKNEYPIEKYINFNLYDFKQDYSSFFNSKNFDKNLIKKLEKIFNEEIDGEKLSIRELENSFNSNDVFKIENEYEIFKTIHNKVWPASSKVKFFLTKDVREYLSIQKQRLDFLNVNFSKILEKDSENNYLNILNSDKKKIKLISWESNAKLCFNFFENYTEQFKIFRESGEKSSQNKKKLFKKIENDIRELNKKNDTKNKDIEKWEEKIQNCQKNIAIEEKKDDINIKEIRGLKIDMGTLQKKKDSLQIELNDNQKKDTLNNMLSQIKQDYERVYIFPDNLIKKLEKLDAEEKFLFSKDKLSCFKKAIIESFSNKAKAGQSFENMIDSDFEDKIINSLISQILNN